MTRLSWVMAIVAAVSMGLLGCNKEEAKKAGDTTGNAVEKTGNAVSNAATQASGALAPTGSRGESGIHNLLADLADYGVSKDSIKKVDNLFAKEDRDRIEPNLDKSDGDLNAAIDQFTGNWKSKYGDKDFKPSKDADNVFGPDFATISEGTTSGDKAAVAASRNDRQTKTLHIAESHGMPAVDVPIISEGGRWRINVPDDVDATALKKNLTKAVSMLNEKKDQWPPDMNDGYRAVAHAMALAVLNKVNG